MVVRLKALPDLFSEADADKTHVASTERRTTLRWKAVKETSLTPAALLYQILEPARRNRQGKEALTGDGDAFLPEKSGFL